MKRLIIFLTLSLFSFETYSQGKDLIFVHPETLPSFPGGLDSLKKFISNNLRYPYKRLDVEGVVYVQFTVNEDGALSDTKVIKGLCELCDKNALDIKGLCELCDKNALEVFSKMPIWIPGKWYDKHVKITMVYPIKFTINR